jgi:peptidoglycan/LPS O-acetylase OafA/YrhL
MGFIRLILAIAVVIAHSSPLLGYLNLTSGTIAVQIFYIISGFYMGFVLTTKYSYTQVGIRNFYSSRFWRLFPLYWAVLFTTIILGLLFYIVKGDNNIFSVFVSDWGGVGTIFKVLVVFASIFLFFQDSLLFIKYQDNKVLGNFLLVPQSWTLAVELLFYLCVPFLNRLKSRYLLVILGLGILLRILMYQKGFYHDPWTYRFFPFEISMFLSGLLMSRLYLMKKDMFEKFKYSWIVVLFCIFLIAIFEFVPIDLEIKKWGLYLIVVTSLPFLFSFSNKFKFDREIGELSYPVYLVHIMVWTFFMPILLKFWKLPLNWVSAVFVLVSIIVAIIANFLINKIIFLIKGLKRVEGNIQ